MEILKFIMWATLIILLLRAVINFCAWLNEEHHKINRTPDDHE